MKELQDEIEEDKRIENMLTKNDEDDEDNEIELDESDDKVEQTENDAKLRIRQRGRRRWLRRGSWRISMLRRPRIPFRCHIIPQLCWRKVRGRG